MGLLDFLFHKKRKHSKSKIGSSVTYMLDFPFTSVLSFYKFPERIKTYNTEKDICFSDVKFGSNYNYFRKHKGKPLHSKTVKENGANIKIALNKRRLDHVRRVSIYYYFDHKFLFGEYIYRQPNEEEIETIKKAVCSKYIPDVDVPEKRFNIIDQNGNLILFSENINIQIKYLWGKENINQRYFDVYTHEDKRKKKSSGDLFNDVFNES